MEVVRNGNAYMPAFSEEQMSEARLKKIYEALYANKKTLKKQCVISLLLLRDSAEKFAVMYV